jgi:F-type H+-transporting ATPase subunit beta
MASTGVISQVIGSTFDAQFPEDDLPEIYNAIRIDTNHKGNEIHLTGEVAKHLGGGMVRAVALGSTDGLTRGMACQDTGAPVSVPVGEPVLGRVFNLLGEPVDEQGPVNTDKRSPIHRDPPEFVDLNPKTEILPTGIKVIDLLCPFVRGGKIGLFGGAGVGKTVIIQEMIARVAKSSAATPSSAASASGPVRATTSGAKCARPSTPTSRATPPTSSTRSPWCSAR